MPIILSPYGINQSTSGWLGFWSTLAGACSGIFFGMLAGASSVLCE